LVVGTERTLWRSDIDHVDLDHVDLDHVDLDHDHVNFDVDDLQHSDH
jgi:hypothetical protein